MIVFPPVSAGGVQTTTTDSSLGVTVVITGLPGKDSGIAGPISTVLPVPITVFTETRKRYESPFTRPKIVAEVLGVAVSGSHGVV